MPTTSGKHKAARRAQQATGPGGFQAPAESLPKLLPEHVHTFLQQFGDLDVLSHRLGWSDKELRDYFDGFVWFLNGFITLQQHQRIDPRGGFLSRYELLAQPA
ncbi:hypothetical protein WJX73_009306 [Symbiochloris irregularis]|uniref:Uncharacterized protein n=1 Tax=Symbiochloris irregularis TaxID=706552 RepID=A0AAW1PZ10_9CHLO